MTGLACILLPLFLGGAARWFPAWRALAPSVAGVLLLLVLSLPWTGDALGGWLLPDPLAVLVLALAAFAWLSAEAAAALAGADVPPGSAALATGGLAVALLADSAVLTLVGAGAVCVGLVLMLRLAAPGRLLGLVACALGVAAFGLAVLGGTVLPGGWAALSWGALPGAVGAAAALGAGFASVVLGLGVACLALPAWSALRGAVLPRTVLMLCGPVGATWLVVALRLRGVVDGNAAAASPGPVLLAVGLGAMVLGAAGALARGRLVACGLICALGAALAGAGLGGAAATGAGLVHAALACLAVVAALCGGWPGVLGLASLALVPPLALFGSLMPLLAAAWVRGFGPGAVMLGAALALAMAAVRRLQLPIPAAAAPVGWVALFLALAGAWAMPAPFTAWLQGIAAAAR